ncbi:hypothetical protein F383_09392 [Gossypium arboreum]|uniref:Uncharacterized protein n=1 Tax=Gossypium arboreum TaxID=29729 RepID=A0A0B0NSA9_GOSAR|nr:hypothetical protein F383_09392 [Gossypium arboreum]
MQLLQQQRRMPPLDGFLSKIRGLSLLYSWPQYLKPIGNGAHHTIKHNFNEFTSISFSPDGPECTTKKIILTRGKLIKNLGHSRNI